MWKRWVQGGLLALSLILASFLLYILAIRSEPEPAAGSLSAEAPRRADARNEQFTFVQSRGGAVQWEVLAKRARVFEAEQRALLEDVQVTLFGEHGWELKAVGDDGEIDTGTKNFALTKREGDIALELQSGYTIYTNHITWTDERREVGTADPVRIVGHGLELTGRGLIGRLDQEEFTVLHDVRVAFLQ